MYSLLSMASQKTPRIFSFFMTKALLFTTLLTGSAVSAYSGAFSIDAPSSVTEGSGENMIFKVTLTAFPSNDCKSNQTYTVNFATTNSGTATAGVDFNITNQSLSIQPASNFNSGVCGSVNVVVPINNDAISEGDESVVAQLSSPSANATLLISTNAGVIIDDDTNLTISINDTGVSEQDVDVNATINIVLNKPAPSGGLTLDYATSNGTATSPADYIASTGTITIPENNTTYPLKITIKGDDINETSEKFYIIISNASTGTIVDNNGTITIFDDDALTSQCSPYVGLITLNEYQNNPHYFDTSRQKIMGNYVELKYIDQLVKQYIDINKWKVSVYSNAGAQEILWKDRDTACTDPYYEVFQYNSNVMGSIGYVVLTDELGREVDVLNIDNSNHYTPKCTSFAYDTDFPSALPQNKEIFRYPDGTGDWSDVGLGANSEGSRCLYVPSNGYDLVYTQFDAIDLDETIPAVVTSEASVPLKTKIVNKPFSVNILSLETDIAGSIGTLKPINQTIKVYFANGNGGSLLDPTGYSVTFNNDSKSLLGNILHTKANKRAKFLFEYCQDSTGTLYNWDQCFGAVNNDWRRRSFSRNTFAIRPNDFNSTITANQIFIAEHNSSITFNANQYNGAGSTDYNESMGSTFAVDINISDGSKVCAAPSITINPNVVFADGIITNNYSFGNIGDFNLSIHERNGNEYAYVDQSDTNDALRLITPYEQQIKVIPALFQIDGNFTNAGNNFTYLSNFEAFPNSADRNMSALLDLNISAKGETNTTIMSNYTSLCYAKDGNLTTTLNAPLIINPATALSKVLWYDRKHNLGSSVPITNATSYLMELNSTQFDSTDTNGTAQVQYLINFDRNVSQSSRPINFRLNAIQHRDSDNVTGARVLNQTTTFYYGRVHAPDYRFSGNSGLATIYYEVSCKDCNITELIDFNITGNQSVDAINWYQNAFHSNIEGTSAPSTTSANITVGVPTHATTTTTTISTTVLPNIGKINLNGANWLVHYPTDFTVEFLGSGQWAGSGFVKENQPNATDTNTTVGEYIHKNTPIRSNKRMSW